MSTIAEKVKQLVVDQLSVSPDQVTDDARFTEDLNADSLDLVELIMALEEEFGIEELGEEDASSISTVRDLVRYLQSKVD